VDFNEGKKMSRWLPYPQSIPVDPGYYMTVYFNFDYNTYLHKGIYWSGDKWVGWQGWRSNPTLPDLSKVKCFAPDTRHDYYAPCVSLASTITERPLCSNI
jgi:hypothetical protein